jgi:hypothetical protein
MGSTAPALLARPKVWFAAHGITHIHRVVTNNGACYRSNDLARIIGHRTRHQRTRPYTLASSRATATLAISRRLRRAVNASQRWCNLRLPSWPRARAAAGAWSQRRSITWPGLR